MTLSKQDVKQIKKLHLKKYRQQEQLFLAEGFKLVVNEILPSQINVKIILISEDWQKNHDLNAINYKNIEVIENNTFKDLSNQHNPEGILAECEIPQQQKIETENKWVIALDYLQDPGNLGTIIRIADWFGISTIVCSTNTAEAYNPKVIQATMGSIARVNIVYTDLINWLSTLNVPIYAATLDGESIYSNQPKEPGVLLIGNESNGLNKEVLNLTTKQITIPNLGQAESLNAAVATGIIVSHLVNNKKRLLD